MVLTVTSAQYRRPGELHVYILSNGSVVYEMPHFPARTGLKFYDAAGHPLHKTAVINEMKNAVKKHKERWRLAK
ncbi:TPA: hypothetical protein ACIO7S_001462 [Salmonella enterica subsp. enterica serovar Birkenhead]